MIADMQLICQVNDALGFFNSSGNPLTLSGLKNLFEINKKDYTGFLKKNCFDDNNEGLFNYLIEVSSYCDEEMIKDILTGEKKKYFVNYVGDGNNGYFEIYEVEK